MPIELAVSGMPRVVIDAETITIGSDPASSVVLTADSRIKARHAVIRRVAGRWLVEAREAESIQVGNLEPARVHWLTAGDVIHLADGGPRITFQPPAEKPAAAAIPLAAPEPIAPFIAVAPSPAVAPPPAAETIAPAPLYDSLFEPLTEPIPKPAAPRREPPVRQTPSAPSPPRKPKPQKPRSGDSPPVRNSGAERDDGDLYRVAEEPTARATPVLRRGEEGRAGFGSSSQSGLGWTTIWVAIGLLALLVGAIIWFGGGAAGGDDHRPASRKGIGST